MISKNLVDDIGLETNDIVQPSYGCKGNML
jgi:hypothetical protein